MKKHRGVNVTEKEYNSIKYLLSLGKPYKEISSICNRSKWTLSRVNTSKNFAEFVKRNVELHAKHKKPEPAPEKPAPEKPESELTLDPNLWSVKPVVSVDENKMNMTVHYNFNRICKQLDRVCEQMELIQRTMTALLDVWKEG